MRKLTEEEKRDILSFISRDNNIRDEKIKSHTNNLIYQDLYGQLSELTIDPRIIPDLKNEIEKNYYKTKVSPGETVGIIAAQSTVQPVTQMTLNSVDYNELILYCERKDTKILCCESNKIKVEKIGHFIDKHIRKNKDKGKIITVDSTEYLPLPDTNFWIPTSDFYGKSSWKRILGLSRHPPGGDLFRFYLKSGRKVTVSKSKSVLIFNSDKKSFEEKNANVVFIGDYMPTVYAFDFIEYNHFCSYNKERNIIFPLTYEFGFILSHFKNNEGKFDKKGILIKESYCKNNNIDEFTLKNICKEFNIRNLYITNIDCIRGFLHYNDSHELKYKENLSFLYSLLNVHIGNSFQNKFNNVILDEIVNIERISEDNYNYKHKYVYDLSVEDTKNFTLFNGITVRDTFHSSGISEKNVTLGVPRLEEIMSATKNPKLINCLIYFDPPCKTLEELQNVTKNYFKEIRLGSLLQCFPEILEETGDVSYDLYWHEYYSNFVSNRWEEYRTTRIRLMFVEKMLFQYNITLKYIAEKIESYYGDLLAVYSPMNELIIDVFLDTSNIKISPELIEYLDPTKTNIYYAYNTVIPLLNSVMICGIEGIKEIFYSDKKNEWILETEGSNLPEILALPFVDERRTTCNSIWEIAETFGIFATKNFLANEINNVVSFDGTYVHKRHFSLIASSMVLYGTVSPISRNGVSREVGPLAKASFEESLINLIKSGVYGEVETTKGVSASIMCGKRANIGTGIFSVLVDNRLLLKEEDELEFNVESDEEYFLL